MPVDNTVHRPDLRIRKDSRAATPIIQKVLHEMGAVNHLMKVNEQNNSEKNKEQNKNILKGENNNEYY
jgi:hypothetical protein